MRFDRITRMGLAEITCRGRQEMWKHLDRLGGPRDTAGAGTRVGGDEGLAAFGRTLPQRFFPGATAYLTPSLWADRMPDAYVSTLAAADDACEGRFEIFGRQGVSFGEPVDWHLDAFSGRRAPLVHWSRLDYLDPSVVGDSKVVWELNRQQWLVALGQAYRATGDGRYAAAFARSVSDWLQSNPPGLGINWTSSLEASLRIISWCWALALFRGAPALSPGLFRKLRRAIRTHAVRVQKLLSYYFAPNTHLTGEALGLFYAGAVFPELPEAAGWRDLATRILVEQFERQVTRDGVHFEQSTCYQRYTVEIGLHFLILGARNGVAVPPLVTERVQSLLDFLLSLRRPDGTVPEIGDADGGWLLPLSRRAPMDVRGVFSTAAALFSRADYAWAAGEVAPETLWLLGAEGVARFDALAPAAPAVSASRAFPDGGYIVMREGWADDGHQLIFDVGPLSAPVSGHGHADLLSIQCTAFGEPLLVDPGTCVYTGAGDWRDAFRATAAHNTVTVDGAGQAVPAGPFGWRQRPAVRLREWRTNGDMDFADAEHDAYGRLADPVRHRRRVLFVKARYWVVVDDMYGAAEHAVDLRFQLAPVPLVLEGAWARVRGRQRGLLLRSFSTVSLRRQVQCGETQPIAGWVSGHYGHRQPAPALVYSAVTRLPLRIVTVLVPLREPGAAAPLVTALLDPVSGAVSLTVDAETVCLDDAGGVTWLQGADPSAMKAAAR